MPKHLLLLCALVCTTLHYCYGQGDSTIRSLSALPLNYFTQVDHKIDVYQQRLTAKTEQTLMKLVKWEDKIHRLLLKTSPETASRLFANKDMTFAGLLERYRQGQQITASYRSQYSDYRDKLTTSLKYIEAQKATLDSTVVKPATRSLQKMQGLETDVAATEATDQFIRERKKQLIDESIKYIGQSKYLTKISKESYYYTETLKNYKELFSDPKKAEATAKALLSKLPAFQKFTQQNSQLSALFGTPQNYGSAQSLAGLQTRASVNALIQDRLSAGGPNAQEVMKQQMAAAQAEMTKLKNKLLKTGGSSTDDPLPDFRPNGQKSKTFLQRMEYGANLQFAKTNSLLPSTADIGVSVGYKLNDKGSAGIGLSYKLGMGSIQHLKFTHQGVGLRSYIDWKWKRKLYVSGGYELNYNAAFGKISQLKQYDRWQRSGLVGLSKKLSMKSKKVKATKVSVLYDLFYNDHLPASPKVVFRMGYSF